MSAITLSATGQGSSPHGSSTWSGGQLAPSSCCAKGFRCRRRVPPPQLCEHSPTSESAEGESITYLVSIGHFLMVRRFMVRYFMVRHLIDCVFIM